ncbi:2-C-methyl-D-erythritol 2,4-cyclodiphosphate synthase, partial [hydrothermal vent metagenome]
MIRIGQGYDVHAFEAGDHLMLGGVKIPYHKKFKAHSDGDVLLHAVCDALLGAMALGDIGQHFPDTDNTYKGINSRELLKNVYGLMNDAGFKLVNLDVTIIAQAPKMSAHTPSMQSNLAADLNALASQISIKATTTEKLGFEGDEQGIAVNCVCLIEKI